MMNGLTQWFKTEGIDYPWGDDTQPYRVWISEVMLQQTVVTTVIPFFKRWMERFPTLAALSQAEEGEVLRAWEGLGYYSRARNIHKTAKILYAGDPHLRGVFPQDYQELVALPGIGDYTASAILSLSFNQPIAVIDANVKRICQRLEAQPQWTKEVESFWREKLNQQIDKDNPGLFNCALMQLGQIVCKRSNPSCSLCPLQKKCKAHKRDLTGKIPQRKKRETIELASQVLIFMRQKDGSLFWIIQRREGIGRGLWTFPRQDSQGALPQGWKSEVTLKERTHSYTKYKEKLNPQVLRKKGGESNLPSLAQREGEGFWATLQELSHLATPAVYRKIIDELTAYLT